MRPAGQSDAIYSAKMKRVEFTITNEKGETLHEPGFVKKCSELPVAIMLAVHDFVYAHKGKFNLPIIIRVEPTRSSSKC